MLGYLWRQLLRHVRTILLLAIASVFLVATSWAIARSLSPKVPIFGFHNLIDESPAETIRYLDYERDELRRLLDYLIDNNYWFLDAETFERYFIQAEPIPALYTGRQPVMLTFDDGLKSVDRYLLPMLEELERDRNLKLKVVLFISPQLLERNPEKYMRCRDVLRGYKRGFYDVQAHGYRHKKLTELTPDLREEELAKSQEPLAKCSQELERSPHFAYPYNAVNSAVLRATQRYYQTGYLYNNEFFRLNPWRNPYKISRLRAFHQDSADKLIRLAAQATVVP